MSQLPLQFQAYITHAKYYYHKFSELDKLYHAGGNSMRLSLKEFDLNREQFQRAHAWLASHLKLSSDISIMAVDYCVLAPDLLRIRLSPKEYLAWLKVSLEALQYTSGSHPLTEAKLFELTGRAYQDIGEYDKAAQYHQQALSMAKTHGLTDIATSVQHSLDTIDVKRGKLSSVLESKSPLPEDEILKAGELFNRGTAHMLKGDYREAITAFSQTLDFARKTEDHNNVVSTLLALANVYTEIGDYDKGMQYASEARSLSREFNLEESLAGSLGVIGSLHFSQKRYDEALVNLQAALEIAMKRNDRHTVAIVNQNIGNVHMMSRKYESALKYLRQARAIYVELDVEFSIRVVDSLIAQCTVHDTLFYKILALNPLNPLLFPIINKILGPLFYRMKKMWMNSRKKSKFR